MSIQDFGALGELIAAIATVLTLGYLALQIRQNTNQSKSNAHRDSADQYTNMHLSIVGNPDLRKAFLQIRDGGRLGSLTSEEYVIVDAVLRSLFNGANRDFMQAQLSIVERSYLRQIHDYLLVHWLPLPLVNDWWHDQIVPAESYEDGFREWVTSELQALHEVQLDDDA